MTFADGCSKTTGHRGRTGDPLYGIRRTLLQAADRLTDRQWVRQEAAWDVADRHAEDDNALGGQRVLARDVYAAPDIHAARDRDLRAVARSR